MVGRASGRPGPELLRDVVGVGEQETKTPSPRPGASGGPDPRRLNGAKPTRFSHRAVSSTGLRAFAAYDSVFALGLGRALGHGAHTARSTRADRHATAGWKTRILGESLARSSRSATRMSYSDCRFNRLDDAMSSARILADIIAGKRPEIDLAGLTLADA